MRTFRAIPLAPAFALAIAACTVGAKPALDDLEAVAQLRQAFQEDAGRPRLLLLLSPT